MMTIEDLKKGYKKFHKHYFVENHFYKDISQSQNPYALVIACSDSRVDPAIVLDSNPGDLFVVRNVANMVPKLQKQTNVLFGVTSAIEFGIKALKIPNIIIMGHANCGGIRRLMHGPNDDFEFIDRWVNIGFNAKQKILTKYDVPKDNIPQDICDKCAMESILLSMQNLLTFEFVQKAVERGELNISGWFFDITNGTMQIYNDDTNDFEYIL